jgi:hypothetical protein
MPGFDGTGPLGLGPMTGRGMGYCVMPLPQTRGGRIQYGYAGINGIKVPIIPPHALSGPYLSGLASSLPLWRSWFRTGFGRGRRLGLSCGRFRFGRVRAYGPWSLGWWKKLD